MVRPKQALCKSSITDNATMTRLAESGDNSALWSIAIFHIDLGNKYTTVCLYFKLNKSSKMRKENIKLVKEMYSVTCRMGY